MTQILICSFVGLVIAAGMYCLWVLLRVELSQEPSAHAVTPSPQFIPVRVSTVAHVLPTGTSRH